MKKILVVDDEQDVRGMFHALLTKGGYDVRSAANAVDAIRLCRREPPDLLLTDLNMPEMNGIELLKAIHSTHPNVPAILMSGQADMRTAAEALRAQAFDFLGKPVDPKDLLSSIRAAIQNAESAGQGSVVVPQNEGRQVGPLYVGTRMNDSDLVVISLMRPLDQFTQPNYLSAFRRLEDEGVVTKRAIILLHGVTYMNNIGLNILLEVYERWKTQGRRVAFAQLSDPVYRYMKMLGYLSYFPVVGSIEDATASLSKGG